MHRHGVTSTTIAHSAIAAAALWSGLGLLAAAWLLLGPGRDPELWAGLNLAALLTTALPLATASYLLRFVRWHLLASRIVPGLDLRRSFLAQAVGFGLTVTPGRLGEVAKLYLVEQRTAVPIARSAPVFVVEKLAEGVGFLALAFGAGLVLAASAGLSPGALASGSNWTRLAWVGLALGAAILVTLLTTRNTPLRIRVRLPFRRRAARSAVVRRLLTVARRPIQEFVAGSWRLLGPRLLVQVLLASLAARLCDAMVLYIVAQTLGFALSPIAAAFILGTSGTVGGLSMLPGGLGAVEASMAGLFGAFGAPASLAIGATLLTRALILWLWVALGLALVPTVLAFQQRRQP
ncbi:MAG: flippase-like domain-containing protein [Chloroflexi bacterium]|nr:flippase-like domain-containing protein [Chloroflexota bacterium]